MYQLDENLFVGFRTNDRENLCFDETYVNLCLFCTRLAARRVL